MEKTDLNPDLNMGRAIKPEDHPVSDFIRDWKEVFFHPTRFFNETAPRQTLSRALVMGLITSWISTAVAVLIGGLFVRSFEENLMTMLGHIPFANVEVFRSLFQWFFGVAGVIIAPILVLFQMAIWSLFLWVSTRILLSKKAVPYETILKTISYSYCSAPLTIVPILGSFIENCYRSVLAIIGLRENLRISTGFSILILTFPILVLFLLSIMGMMLLGVGIFAIRNAFN